MGSSRVGISRPKAESGFFLERAFSSNEPFRKASVPRFASVPVLTALAARHARLPVPEKKDYFDFSVKREKSTLTTISGLGIIKRFAS